MTHVVEVSLIAVGRKLRIEDPLRAGVGEELVQSFPLLLVRDKDALRPRILHRPTQSGIFCDQVLLLSGERP